MLVDCSVCETPHPRHANSSPYPCAVLSLKGARSGWHKLTPASCSDVDIWAGINRPKGPAPESRTIETAGHWVTAQLDPRNVLASYLDCTPLQIIIDRTCPKCAKDHGKPKVLPTKIRLDWNLAHCNELTVLAISRSGKSVGVDVEHPGRLVNPATVVERFFSKDEHSYLDAAGANRFTELFLKMWTGKEAYLKAIGIGLARGLSWFAIQPDQPRELRLRLDENVDRPSWAIDYVNIASFTVAIATQL